MKLALFRFEVAALAAVLVLSFPRTGSGQTSPGSAEPPSQEVTPPADHDHEPKSHAEDETAAEQEDHVDPLRIYDELNVSDRGSDLEGITDSATEGVTGQKDLAQRPILRPGEVLESIPGVIITQHSGGGKANQYFLRGFNLDHGTDFRVSVDGMQVNMPSHGHGQGYADLNFLIPELVGSVDYRKGTYWADQGDFSAAGAANIQLLDALPKGYVSLTGGSFGFGRALVADSWTLGSDTLLGALEIQRSDGPWKNPEDLERTNGLLRYTTGDPERGATITAMGYDSSWKSTDQIPKRAVTEGRIDRFDTIDPSDRGESSRYSLSAEFRRGSVSTLDRIRAYVLSYSLDLFSNFTYFLSDPENGDQFEQVDDRTAAGLRVDRQWTTHFRGHDVESLVGFDVRADWIDNGLFSTRERRRLSTTREDSIQQVSAAPFAQARVRWTPWLRTVTGFRLDTYHAEVDSDLAANSGSRQAALASPKISLLFGPWRSTELFVNYGWGFHSNDARGATIRVDPATGEPAPRVDPLVRAKSADVGVRFELLPGLHSTLTAFRLDLDSELLFVGDAGSTDASRPSRRTGFELANFWQVRPWLAITADASASRSRFSDEDEAGDRIPGAIDHVVAAGVTLENLGPWEASVRLRYFGPRDLIEDGSIRSRSSEQLNAQIGYAFGSSLRLRLEGFNLLDDPVSDIDYFYASRLPGEPEEGIEDIHFHPAEPLSWRLSAVWSF